MPDPGKKQLRYATIVYWVLLIYIIAALFWWALLLLQQNREIGQLQSEAVTQSAASPAAKQEQLEQIKTQQKRNNAKYLGEGFFFLLLILIGAVFIYRSVRRQFQLQQQQRNFVMAVTHELKTPIAVSRLNLETLQKYNLDESRKDRLLHMTLQETLRLDTLINNILVASQLEGDSYKTSRETVEFTDLVNDVVRQFSQRYPDRKLMVDIEENVMLVGDALLLKLLVSNLLENAGKYAPKETPIEVALNRKECSVVLEVCDQGPGIPDEEKKLVFRKFYRIGNEETRKAQGTGLGLFLCKKIAEDHRGQVEIKDNQPGGSKFIVRFSV